MLLAELEALVARAAEAASRRSRVATPERIPLPRERASGLWVLGHHRTVEHGGRLDAVLSECLKHA